ncbi:hypothetical protein D3C77_496140 [compost metagenome]
MCGKLDADVGQLILQASTHWPVELAHEGKTASLIGAQGRSAEALQPRSHQRYPGVFCVLQVLAVGLGAARAIFFPGGFGLLRVTCQVLLVLGAEEVGAALYRQTPGPDQPGEQQAKTDLQQGQFPQQRMPTH